MQITVGASTVTVTDLGRYVQTGNKQSHALSVIRASDGAQVAAATVNLATAARDSAGFAYAPLATPVTLDAAGTYYIVSAENGGGDTFEGSSTFPTLAHSSVASIQGGVYRSGSAWVATGTGAGANQGYVPVSFKYRTSI
jgi:hypothetical protein